MINDDSIEYGGLHHRVLVCQAMKKTVDCYTRVLEMKLKKGFEVSCLSIRKEST